MDMTNSRLDPAKTIFALLLLGGLILPAASALAEDTNRRILSMTGTGEVRRAPENATISSGVVSHGRNAAEALAVNTETMAAMIARLKSAGIEARDLQTSNFSVSPRYSRQNKSNQPPRIVGYAVSNQLTVMVRNLDDLGRVLDEVVSLGANQVNGPNFGFNDPEKLQDIARTRAAADASRKARLYAEALGLTLGDIVSVSESGGYSPQPMAMQVNMRMAAEVSVPIETGEIGLNAQVNIIWSLK